MTDHHHRQTVHVSYDSCESLKGSSTPVAAATSRQRQKRISILKKLRDKLGAADVASTSASASTAADQPTGSTIIRVGTVSSCDAGSTVRSWRVVDEFLRNRFVDFSPSRQSTLSNRSLSSGKTLIYDDKSLPNADANSTHSAATNDFRTVIKVDEPTTSLPPSLERVNVIVERNASVDDSSDGSFIGDYGRSASSPPSVRTVHQQQGSAVSVAENCNTATGISSNNDDDDDKPSAVTVDTGRRQSLPSTAAPPAVIFGSSRINAETAASAANSSHIELINWRARPDFDADPTAPSGIRGGGGNDQSQRLPPPADLPNLNMLTPDDLPRLYPGWNMPPIHPPFRFDEEFEEEPKGCCGSGRFSHSMMIRVFIAVISLIGLSCVVVGIVLGALTVSGSTRLTLCLLMIGVGVVLIIVSGIAWRLTSLDPAITPSCWTILGLRAQRPQSVFPERRSRTAYYRVRNVRRPMAPFCGMMQSEFAWRPPPPTYQATMQELRLQTFLCARNHREQCGPSGSPPPTYRSDHDLDNGRPSLNDFIQRISRPPSYRSHDNMQIEERPLLPCDVQLGDAVPSTVDRQATDNALQSTENPGASENSAIAASENVHVDDRVKLVASDHLQRSLSNENLPCASASSSSSNRNQIRTTNIQIRTRLCNTNSTPSLFSSDGNKQQSIDTVSVIDCSAADPVVTMATEATSQQQQRAVAAASRFSSPQLAAAQHVNRRYRGAGPPPATTGGYYRQPVPFVPRGSVGGPPAMTPPPPSAAYSLRFSLPPFFAAHPHPHYRHHHHHHRAPPPLMPIRVQPPGGGAQCMRWRAQHALAAANMQIQMPPVRLPTVAANVREEQMSVDAATNRGDPSYV